MEPQKFFTILHKGGTVLWDNCDRLVGNPVNQLIKSVFIPKSADTSFVSGPFTLYWLFDKEFELIYIVICERVREAVARLLLSQVRATFVKEHAEALRHLSSFQWELSHFAFSASYDRIVTSIDEAAEAVSTAAVATPTVPTDKPDDAPPCASPSGATSAPSAPASAPEYPPDVCDIVPSGRGRGGGRGGARGRGGGGRPTKGGKPAKSATTWSAELGGRVPGPEAASPVEVAAEVERMRAQLGEPGKVDADDWAEVHARAAESERDASASGGVSSRVWRALRALPITTRKLTPDDVRPVAEALRTQLVDRGVSLTVAESLTSSLSRELLGRTADRFETISSIAKSALKDALMRVLGGPSVDIVAEVRRHRDAVRARGTPSPYVIVVCGVNGVGKSTTVAKLANHLGPGGAGLSVMLAACDTFRTGAIEQLRVHAECLRLPFFASGYGKNDSLVAAEAIRRAAADGIDVVLVDTAGRLQENEAFMRSLADLIRNNAPQQVLFVGEAQVGHDGIHQLETFDSKLRGAGPGARGVDCIFLTKYDLVGDRTGTAVSMAHTSGKPIAFVGTGQTYSDIRRLPVEVLVDTLLM